MQTQVQVELVFVHPKIQVCEAEDDDDDDEQKILLNDVPNRYRSIDRSIDADDDDDDDDACARAFFAFWTSVFFHY